METSKKSREESPEKPHKQYKSLRKSTEPIQPHRYPRRVAIAASASFPSSAAGKGKGNGKSSPEAGESTRPTVLDFPNTPTPAARVVTVVPDVGLRCEVVVGSPTTPSGKRVYKATNRHTEGKSPVYAVVFNFLDVRYYDVFASRHRLRPPRKISDEPAFSVSIYRCLMNGNFALLQVYLDDEVSSATIPNVFSFSSCFTLMACIFSNHGELRIASQRDESFYTVSWACDTDGTPLLVAAGKSGVIRIINCATEKIHKV
ncbi:hypothetical protein ABZP36_034924 [Zizania latifolia]